MHVNCNIFKEMTKKQKIEAVSMELFLKHGFKKVTIDEICRKAHVSRKTYYTYYENKTALVLFTIDNISDNNFLRFSEIIEGDASFTDKLAAALDLKYEFSKKISMEFVADFFDPGATEILNYWKSKMQASIDLLFKFFQKAQSRGEMNPNLKLEYVMWLYHKFSDIMSSGELLTMFESPEELTRQISQSLVSGILPPPNNTIKE